MSEVSVLGLGAMGSAIARALMAAGRTVTVWNRTAVRAQPLVADGAVHASTAVDAIVASPVTVVCVDNYEVARVVLDNAQGELLGKTLIQLTSDTGTAAEELAAWASRAGAAYLDGVIMAYPSDMGSADAAVLVAGDPDTWTATEAMLRDIAGGSVYVGPNVRVPSMLSAAAIAPLLGLVLGATQGAVMCEAEGFPVADYAAMMAPLSGLLSDQLRHTFDTISAGAFEDPEAALKTYASSVTDRTAESRARGVNVEFYGFVDDLFRRAIAQGLGDEELAAIIKLWR